MGRLNALIALCLTLLANASWAGHAVHPDPLTVTCQARPAYSPHGGAAAAIVSAITGAEWSIKVAIFSLTHDGIVTALVAARARGVEVGIKADKLQSSQLTQQDALLRLRQAGALVEVSTQTRLLHHKFAVVDDRWVVTGSFNWTASAEDRNRENVLVLDCPDLARAFAAEWRAIKPDAP